MIHPTRLAREALPATPRRTFAAAVASTVAAAVAALVVSPLAAAQQEAWRIGGSWHSERLGRSIARLPDRDGDGIADFVVGAPDAFPQVLGVPGAVRVLSGRDLSLLLEVEGESQVGFGDAVADAGDFDGDGVNDLLLGIAGLEVARVVSGVDGRLLREYAAPAAQSRFGTTVVAVGDLTGDHFPDYAVGAPDEDGNGRDSGAVHVVDGAQGVVLRSFFGSAKFVQLGERERLVRQDDLDGDGSAELALLDEDGTGARDRVARIVSPATGAELLAVRFNRAGDSAFLPSSIAPVGDLDGDGAPDFAVGAPPVSLFVASACFVLSGADGSELLRLRGGIGASWVVAARCGDLDGDAIPELVLADDPFQVTRQPTVSLRRGSDGSEVVALRGPDGHAFGRTLVADADLDGDGHADLLIGDPDVGTAEASSGALASHALPSGALLHERLGVAWNRPFGGPLALLEDVDGDGATDFVAASPGSVAGEGLLIHSGRDGSAIRRLPTTYDPSGDVVALPDLDGDGHDEIAVGTQRRLGVKSRVDVRSSADGRRLRAFDGGDPVATGFGEHLAAGVQPGSGAIELLIGSPRDGNHAGRVDCYDVASGTLRFGVAGLGVEEFGTACAFVGDQDGDGVGDWVVGAPDGFDGRITTGRVALLSGVDGTQLRERFGSDLHERFGSEVAALDDLDGDGAREFAVRSISTTAMRGGIVHLFAGGGARLHAKLESSVIGDRIGSEIAPLPDVNGDSIGDWAAIAHAPLRVEVRSGATLGLLMRQFEGTLSGLGNLTVAGAAPWQAAGSPSGDALPDLIAAEFDRYAPSSAVWMVRLSELLLQIEPPAAVANTTVFAWLRGAPTGAPAVLVRTAIDGVPDGQLLGFGSFDVAGEWYACGVVPPGLAGTSWNLQGFALGFDGRVNASPEQELRFE
ncbi:MAG: hypothetical protein JNL90_19340 [Planctomycetes bacterium]|nr:hypothetical protein [Planctomycetota bacterium]